MTYVGEGWFRGVCEMTMICEMKVRRSVRIDAFINDNERVILHSHESRSVPVYHDGITVLIDILQHIP